MEYVLMDMHICATTHIKYIANLKVISPVKNGTPLQYSCLANPMDGGAWWAAVHGIAKSQT